MEDLIRKYIPKSSPSDHPFKISSLIVGGVFIVGFLILGAINANYLFIQILCLLLIPLFVFFGLKSIRQVEFGTSITIKPIYGKSKTIEYSQLKKFYKHDLGELDMFIWVLKYNKNSKLKKITFYDDDLNFEEFKEVLKLLKNDRNQMD